MKDRKIYVVGSTGYANWMNGRLVEKMEDADLVVLVGGSDVSPHLYGESAGKYTYCSPHTDKVEVAALNKAISLKKKIYGTCKGLQHIAVCAGGKLIQDMDHPHNHTIKTYDGKELIVNSLHHQIPYLAGMPKEDYKVIAWAENLSPTHTNGEGKEVEDAQQEIEIAVFPKINALGIQSHPEMMYGRTGYKETVSYMQELLDNFMEDKL